VCFDVWSQSRFVVNAVDKRVDIFFHAIEVHNKRRRIQGFDVVDFIPRMMLHTKNALGCKIRKVVVLVRVYLWIPAWNLVQCDNTIMHPTRTRYYLLFVILEKQVQRSLRFRLECSLEVIPCRQHFSHQYRFRHPIPQQTIRCNH